MSELATWHSISSNLKPNLTVKRSLEGETPLITYEECILIIITEALATALTNKASKISAFGTTSRNPTSKAQTTGTAYIVAFEVYVAHCTCFLYAVEHNFSLTRTRP